MSLAKFATTAEAASVQPPEHWSGLSSSLVAVSGPFVRWRLACTCGSAHAGVGVGPIDEGSFLDPLILVCSACGKETVFFDSSKHGYDGILNGGSCYRQAAVTSSLRCGNGHSSTFTLDAEIGYNIDLGELEEIVQEEGGRVSDYFDFVGFEAICTSCQEKVVLGDWECA